jgi:YHS domain-containing protein
MAQVTDVVCGMIVDSETAPARSRFEGTTYYFCTPECRDQFEANPARYTSHGKLADSQPADHDGELEQHEPPFTKAGGITAPKFGAAGSGGLEYEPIPEQHKDR